MELTRAELHCLKTLVRLRHADGTWANLRVDPQELYGKLNAMWAAAADAQGHKP